MKGSVGGGMGGERATYLVILVFCRLAKVVHQEDDQDRGCHSKGGTHDGGLGTIAGELKTENNVNVLRFYNPKISY